MRHQEILAKITANVAELCGSDPAEIDSAMSFVEIGLDSLMLTKLTQFLQDTFQVAVEPREMFEDGASITALTELIAQRTQVSPAAPAQAVSAAAGEPAGAPFAGTQAAPFAGTQAAPSGGAPAAPPAGAATAVRPAAAAPAAVWSAAAAATVAVFDDGSPLQKLFAQQLQLMSQQLQILQQQGGAPPQATVEPPAAPEGRGAVAGPGPSPHPGDGGAPPRQATAPQPAMPQPAASQPATPPAAAPRQAAPSPAKPQPAVPQPPRDEHPRPALSDIVGQVFGGQAEADLSADLEHYANLVPEMEELSLFYVREALARLGWPAPAGPSTATADLAAALGVDPRRHRLFARLLAILAEAGYVQPAGDGWEARQDLASGADAARFADLHQRFPRGEIELSVLERCGRNLAQVLRGECDPLSLLFPADGFDVAQLYENAPAAKLLNDLAGLAVAAELRQWPADRMVRILEIGAGTGGTTASVLPLLPEDRTDYVFSDVSAAFLARARKKFSGYPFLRYLQLDIEADPGEQGFEPGQFDLIVAANVLHATEDLGRSLANVRQLLAPHGLLVLLESSGRQRWVDLTVGLTDGWWRFRDADVRPDYPLVSAATWRSLLLAAGFAEATDAVCALERGRTDEVGHPLILGRAPAPAAAAGNNPQMVGWFRLPEVQTKKLTPRQRAHMERLSARYIARTQQSKRLTERYRPRLADNRALFGFRMNSKEMLYPVYATRSQGSRIEDIDGNEYIDLTMGFGTNLFGHRPPFVQAALEEQLAAGIQIGPQTTLAGEVAELICELTGNERVNFCNTGTEAVMVAMRVARTAAKRDTIVLFQRGFHGTSDGVLAMGVMEDGRHRSRPKWAGVTPGHVQEVMVLEFDDPRSLEIIEANADQIGAVMVEPVQSSNPLHQAGAFLRDLRRLTLAKGIVLIFDEMVTGFRLHPQGAQGWFGVQADLVTYGKIIGGGMPMSVLAGKGEYLDRIDGGQWRYGDASYPQVQPTFTGGTYSKHPLALAASRAVLRHLRQEGPGLQLTLNRRTDQLAARLNRLFEDQEVPGKVANCGSMMRFMFTQDMELFFYHLSSKGVYIWEGRGCFISTAHTDEDVDQVVQAVEESIREMRDGDFLPPLEPKVRPAAKAAAPSCLVKLREKGTQPPLFLAPGVYGTSLYLASLVRCIDSRQPVFGLQARGLRAGEVPHDSIEAMAGEFVEAIRTVSPDGPYLLGGHSTGAVVAFETALQLQRLGQTVDFLAILDNPPFQKDNPMTEEHRRYDDARWMDNFAQGINPTSKTQLAPYAELRAMAPLDLWTAFADWLKAAGQLAQDAPAAQARNLLDVFKVAAVAELVYRPREMYRGAITLFRAADAMGTLYDSLENAAGLSAAAGNDDPTMFWSEVSSQPVEVVPVPGDHLSMVFEPHCRTLAQRLTAAMAAQQGKAGAPALALAAG